VVRAPSHRRRDRGPLSRARGLLGSSSHEYSPMTQDFRQFLTVCAAPQQPPGLRRTNCPPSMAWKNYMASPPVRAVPQLENLLGVVERVKPGRFIRRQPLPFANYEAALGRQPLHKARQDFAL
jgi:hypothetical protein